MPNGQRVPAHQRRNDRGSHAAAPVLLLPGLINGPVRQLDRAGQAPGARGTALSVEGVRFHGRGIIAKIIQKDIHAHLAGDFAGGLAAHAVTDDKDAVARIVAEVVFVVRAHAPDVGFAGNFHRKRHIWVPCLKS